MIAFAVEASAWFATKDPYDFVVGDRIAVRSNATIYQYKNNSMINAYICLNDQLYYIGAIKDITMYYVTTRYYGLVSNLSQLPTYWIKKSSAAPTANICGYLFIYDMSSTAITVNLKNSANRVYLLKNKTSVANTFKQIYYLAGFRSFNVSLSDFAWELAGHAYATEYNVPGKSHWNIANCGVSKLDWNAHTVIELAKFWYNTSTTLKPYYYN